MEYEHIRFEPGRVARLILNRPQYRNAQSRRMIEEMDDAFAAAVHDDAVRVIILSGAGGHFSAGHDLGTPEEKADRQSRGRDESEWDIRYERFYRTFLEATLRWRNLEKPTIAMVQGYCIFGGWMFASAMDLIFASEDALFLPSHTQYFPVPWDIGPRKAKEVLFESRFILAREAFELGFVNRVYAPAELERETLAFAERVAGNDPFFTRMVKFSVNNMEDAKGFSQSVQAAFHTYFVSATPRLLAQEASGGPPGRRQPLVGRAVEHLKRGIPDTGRQD